MIRQRKLECREIPWVAIVISETKYEYISLEKLKNQKFIL